MKIIGRGHEGIVVAGAEKTAKKLYLNKGDWALEKTNLDFLNDIQAQGFKIECKIPKLLNSSQGEWTVNGTTYNYCNTMERLYGTSANSTFNDNPEKLGTKLGQIYALMHTRSKPYINQWVDKYGDEDKLLAQIYNKKAKQVIDESKDAEVKRRVNEAVSYLKSNEPLLASNRTLSHIDLTPNNTVINKDFDIQGIVDWGSFCLTNPSLTLYQMPARANLWKYIKKEYERLGCTILYDTLHAAETIHLAWAPIICEELGVPLEKEAGKEGFDRAYENFQKYKSS